MTEKVLDFNQKREESIEQKRRNFERLLFQNFLGAYSVITEGEYIYPITLVDISKEGCLFQIPWNQALDEKYPDNTEITLRMYFTKHSYVPTIVKIKYAKEHKDRDGQSYMRYGCEFDRSTHSFEALASFIDFMYKFAEYSTTDKGDTRVLYF